MLTPEDKKRIQEEEQYRATVRTQMQMPIGTTKEIRWKGIFVLGSVLMLTGCDLVDSKMQAKAREYFSAAEIVHPTKDVLQIDTHLSITEKFAAKVMGQLIRENLQELRFLPIAGYSILVFAFEGGTCGWYAQRPTYFGCNANADQTVRWYSLDGLPLRSYYR